MRVTLQQSLRKLSSFALTVWLMLNPFPVMAVEPTVIALFGDSITVGKNATSNIQQDANGTTTVGVPTIFLGDLFKAAPKRSAIVANWGFGGSTSSSGASRITADLNTNTSRHNGKDYYVLIMYGTNDFNGDISASTTQFNIGLMIDKARLVGYKPIIGTLTPRDDQLSEVQARNAKIISIAGTKGAFVVNHYSVFVNYPGGWETLIDPEVSGTPIRVHPNDSGYLVIAQNWFKLRLAELIDPDPIVMAPIIFLLLAE